MLRKLGSMEQAWTLGDDFAPLVVTIALRLVNAPVPEILQQSLKHLQLRHPLLRARISRANKTPHFEAVDDAPPISIQVLSRKNGDTWQLVVETELNTRFDSATAPLMRCTYLYSDEQRRGDVILSFHHTIIDGASAANFCHELLTLCAQDDAGRANSAPEPLVPLPNAEALFPPRNRVAQLVPFIFRQIDDEIGYRRKLGNARRAPIHSKGRCKILTLQFSPEETTALIKRARRERVSLNNALSAAMLVAMKKHIYSGQPVPMRYITFADLRPYLNPPVPAEDLGTCIAMLRYTVLINGHEQFWMLAREIHQQVSQSTRRGDKFSASLLSKPLMQGTIGMKSFRLATTALSYAGVIDLPRTFGAIQVEALHGFISNNVLGPEYTASVKILFGSLLWDILYLDSDMNEPTAQKIADEIRNVLISASLSHTAGETNDNHPE